MSIKSQYLDGSYSEKNPSFHVEDSAWKAEQIWSMMEANDLLPSSVCEVGCGAGEILVQLESRHAKAIYTGYELSPQAFQLCAKKASQQINFLQRDLFLEPEQLSFDLMLCIDVIEHVENPFEFLRRLVARSKSFIFHIPLDMNVQMVLRSRPLLHVRSSVGHIHYFSKDTALALLRECGFRVNDWRYTESGLDLAKSRKAKFLRIPRKLAAFCNKDFCARILGGYSLLVYATRADEDNL